MSERVERSARGHGQVCSSGDRRAESPPGGAGPVPETPAAAGRVFGEALPAAERYVARLAGDGVTRGLIGPREVPRLWERHVLNSAAVAEAVPHRSRVVDVGSGAGLPGIPLGLARPDLSMTLVEPMARRVEFLREAVAEIDGVAVHGYPGGLQYEGPPGHPDRLGADSRWRVVRGRAEDRTVVGAVGQVDVVTARAVAPLPRLVGWCRGLMRPGTRLVALVGIRARDELPGLLPELAAAGMRDVHARAVGAGLGDAATTVVVMTRGGE